MFTIGEFSKLCGLTVKTLRFYHEEGLLVPAYVDPDTGYRYYNESQIEAARIITYFRTLEFPLNEIKELLGSQGNDDLLDILERQQSALQDKIRRLRKAATSLDRFITQEREALAMAQIPGEILEKSLESQLIAGIRMQGKYSDCGQGFAAIARKLGRFICGKPFLLHYDTEYKELDADFEACMPIRQEKTVDGVSIRVLPGGRLVTLVHKGPYDQLGRSYAKVFKYVKEKGYDVTLPTREVYLKGPGMIFKGNPEKYLTEIQIPIASARKGE